MFHINYIIIILCKLFPCAAALISMFQTDNIRYVFFELRRWEKNVFVQKYVLGAATE